MKHIRLRLFAVLALLALAGSPLAESALAAQKKKCTCKPAIRRKTTSRTVAKSKATTSRPKAAVAGSTYIHHTFPVNQVLTLKMLDALSSSSSRIGDRFRATVVIPAYVGAVPVIPAGAIVEGRVTAVTPARTRGRAGEMSVAFDHLLLPDGTKLPIEGALTDVQDSATSTVDEESHVSGRSSDRKQVIFVGGGGAGGAIVGGAIGGGKGAGIGAVIGAGAGVAGALLTKGNEAEVKRGTEISMMTLRPIVFTTRSEN